MLESLKTSFRASPRGRLLVQINGPWKKVFNGDIVKLREFVSTGNTSLGENSFFAPSSFQPQINFRQGRPEGSTVFACCIIKCASSGLMTIKGKRMAVWPKTVPSLCRCISLAASRFTTGLLSVWDTIVRNWRIADDDTRAFFFIARFYLSREIKTIAKVLSDQVTLARVASISLRLHQPGPKRISTISFPTRELNYTLHLLSVPTRWLIFRIIPIKRFSELQPRAYLLLSGLTCHVLQRATTLITARLPEIRVFSPVFELTRALTSAKRYKVRDVGFPPTSTARVSRGEFIRPPFTSFASYANFNTVTSASLPSPHYLL